MTPRQRDTLAFVEDFTSRHGFPPTVREVMAGLGLRSPGTAHEHLRALRVQGQLTWNPRCPRTVHVPEKEKTVESPADSGDARDLRDAGVRDNRTRAAA